MAFTPKDPNDKRNTSKKMKGTSTNTGENGCKGCKCKKSECLKLYCVCFAAGTYCTDPCSCQGCFNTAEYEDAVLEKKKKIESRNRLAFLPKIVPQSNVLPSNNNNAEDANAVTASRTRHRKGCNCKKSTCMKKYCECYGAHVGCSNECRCKGCKNEYGMKGCYVAKDDHALSNERAENNGLSNVGIMHQSSPCSAVPTVRQPLDSEFDILLEEGIFSPTTGHSNYLWQTFIMESESHMTNMPSNQVGPAPPEQGPVLQPQLHIPRHQQPLSQNIQNHIAPQPNNLLPSTSGLAQTPSQNIGQNNYMFSGSQGQSSFLPSFFQQPNNVHQHSTDFMLQQHSQVTTQRHRQQQSSIAHDQQQTQMAMSHEQPMLTAQQQHQLLGPQSNDATNIQVHPHLLRPSNNVSDVGQPDRLFSQQNNLTDLLSEFPPYFF